MHRIRTFVAAAFFLPAAVAAQGQPQPIVIRASTVTSSPIFIELRVQPARIRPFGLPISRAQFVTVPASPVTSMENQV